MCETHPCVYILCNKPRGVLYIGVTSNLRQRIWQHKQHPISGFAQKYGLDRLVWYEVHREIREAIIREKRLKKWNRVWKVELIESSNPGWADLFDEISRY